MKPARGFTLLEVLLATVLLASAIAVTAASVRGIAQARQKSEARLQLQGERNAVAQWLRARIGRAMAVNFDAGDGARAMFLGGRQRMEFVTDLPPYHGLTGPMRQVIELQPMSGGQLICVAAGVRETPGLRCEPGDATTLAAGLAQVEFRYRGRDEAGRPGPWQPEWPRREILPEWIEVRLIAPPGQAEWPQVLVRIPLAVNPAP